MNRIIIACMLAACVAPVHAKAVAYIPNKAGARIIITDQPCRMDTPYHAQAYAIDAQGEAHAGCWMHDSTNIYVYWLDMAKPVAYPITSLTKMGDVL